MKHEILFVYLLLASFCIAIVMFSFNLDKTNEKLLYESNRSDIKTSQSAHKKS